MQRVRNFRSFWRATAGLIAVIGLIAPCAVAQTHFCDVNNSGRVDAIDVQFVINAALGLIPGAAYDVDGSGRVDAIDVQLVISAALGYPVGTLVPDVRGMGQADAETALAAAGLVVGPVTYQGSVSAPPGSVTGQTPGAGSTVIRNGTVSLVVATGPEPDFHADTTFGDAVLRVRFCDASGLDRRKSLTWTWDFGDGSPPSHDVDPTHEYAAPGSYDVTMTITAQSASWSVTKPGFVQVANPAAALAGPVDLSTAVILTRPGAPAGPESMAATVLVEEVERRTGVELPIVTSWPAGGTVIALMSHEGHTYETKGPPPVSRRADGFRLFVEQRAGGPKVIWLLGADGRGALYAVGKLLRSLSWTPSGQLWLAAAPNVATAPEDPLRGHQLGYRNTANSYDAWDAATYEQYIRELVVFGANAVENIPMDGTTSPHFPLTQPQMHYAMSDICDRYGIEYWVWTPAEVDVSNPTLRNGLLAQYRAIYQNCARLDGVFIPGGDPGNNDPAVLMPFLAEVAALLHSYWPDAGLWVSNQGFEHDKNDCFFNYLATQQPTWLEGVVFGPWAKLTIGEMRSRTPGRYKLRRYPDITHSARCQYPVEHRDRALAHTLGRENPNPRPLAQLQIHRLHAPNADGFIAYSDGCHDDLNKQLWSMSGWDSGMSVDDMLLDYTRFSFGAAVAVDAADGLAGLEQNEVGPLSTNANVDATLALWQGIENTGTLIDSNWRWQMYVLRAYYDTYIKDRLLYESALEADAYAILANADTLGSVTAMAQASTELSKATTLPVRPDLRLRIEQLCAALFGSIGLQTSVGAPYLASGLERGAVLDFVDHPVNDRLWLEAEFARIGALGGEAQRLTEIGKIVNWEDPGPGGFYDDLGNAARQPHLVQQKNWDEDPGFVESTQDEFSWNSFSWRLSWQDQAQTLFGQPLQMRYTGLSTTASYRLRAMYIGRFNATMTLLADGVQIHGPVQGVRPPSMSTVQSYDIPQALTADGALDLEWLLNGGRGCQVAEVWLEVR